MGWNKCRLKNGSFCIGDGPEHMPVFSSQSYALYITGDENATSTDISKYLAKVSAGIFLNIYLGGSLFVCICAHVLTSCHYCISAPSVPASGSNNTERKVNYNDAGSPVTWLCLFLLWQKAKQYNAEVTAIAGGMTELVIDFVGILSPLYLDILTFSNKTKPNVRTWPAVHSSGTNCHLHLTCRWSASSVQYHILATIENTPVCSD